MEPTKMRALRCRNCGSDWNGGRCGICGYDRFIDVVGYYPDMGPAALRRGVSAEAAQQG